MLRLLIPTGSGYTWVEHAPPAPFPDEFLWADLFEPTPEEEKAVESLLTVDVPTRDEMKEIETSNRLYEEGGAVYMTATVGSKLDSAAPESSAITFILANDRLITNRYVDPTPVRRFMTHVERSPAACTSSATLLAGLLEAFTERIADLLESVQVELDSVSLIIFPRTNGAAASNRDLHAMIQKIGVNGDLISKARESLVSFQRLLMYVQQATNVSLSQDQRGRFKSTLRDVQSLSDHASFLGNKVQFLLDAVLGLINLEQNNIIKIFSVAAVMFLPPTLVASIYGMNFHFMPELDKHWGYPMALVAMVVSAVIPYLYFRRKGWL
ncbi:MAG TPA: magnesium transporter CorA family protein [Steroidobacteraceae bacterium]|jgi:magnesium transporter|nr:magnesium transporter CorA family protein [Steroidobacteraceae bacterium]